MTNLQNEDRHQVKVTEVKISDSRSEKKLILRKL